MKLNNLAEIFGTLTMVATLAGVGYTLVLFFIHGRERQRLTERIEAERHIQLTIRRKECDSAECARLRAEKREAEKREAEQREEDLKKELRRAEYEAVMRTVRYPSATEQPPPLPPRHRCPNCGAPNRKQICQYCGT